ncbi:MAG: acyl-ACP--UDP-N-acetylglucosamine O-acyltransferase [Campylobacterota bacterium]
MAQIHPTAIVEEGAHIGKNCNIGPYAYISKDAILGDECVVMQGAIIDGKTTLGNRCQVFYNAVVGSIPQDLKYKGEEVELIIGDKTVIREFCQINTGTEGGGSITRIGTNCLVMAYVHVAHDAQIGNNVILVNNATIAGHVEIGNSAIVGGMSAVHQFCKIGELAMVGGGSILTQDIPPFCICEGNRAYVRGLNLTGLRRNIEDKNEIQALKNAYKLLFRSNVPMKQQARELYDNSTNQRVKRLAKFVLQTKRGIPLKRKSNE